MCKENFDDTEILNDFKSGLKIIWEEILNMVSLKNFSNILKKLVVFFHFKILIIVFSAWCWTSHLGIKIETEAIVGALLREEIFLLWLAIIFIIFWIYTKMSGPKVWLGRTKVEGEHLERYRTWREIKRR